MNSVSATGLNFVFDVPIDATPLCLKAADIVVWFSGFKLASSESCKVASTPVCIFWSSFFRGLAFPPHVSDEHRRWKLNFLKTLSRGKRCETPLSCTGVERWKMNVSLPLRLFYDLYHPKLVFLLRKMFKLVGLEYRSVKRPSRVPLTRPRGSELDQYVNVLGETALSTKHWYKRNRERMIE